MADGILWQIAGGIGRDWNDQYQKGVERAESNAIKSNRRSVLSQLALGPDGTVDAKAGLTQLIRSGDLQGAAQFAQTAKMLNPETTDEIREYNLYRQQGGQDTFTDWKVKLKTAGATRVNNVINTGENQYAKTLAESDAKGFVGINEAGSNAATRLRTLAMLENISKDPNFYSGFGGETANRVKQALTGLGINDSNVAGPGEVFRALTNQLTLDATGGKLGAGVSNADVAFLQSINPNLSTTPEGNRLIIEAQRKVAQRQQEISRLARIYAQRRGRFDQAGFNDFLSQWAAENPIFNDADIQKMKSAPAAATAPANTQQRRQQPAAPRVGEVRNGYRFKGGNPADQNSWEPVR